MNFDRILHWLLSRTTIPPNKTGFLEYLSVAASARLFSNQQQSIF